MKAVLGNPAYQQIANGELIIGYVASPDYKLLSVFPQPTQTNPHPKIDHVNVFYPRGTVNSMANDPGLEW